MKKLTTLHLKSGRVITAFILTDNQNYYQLQVVDVKTPMPFGDWEINDKIKIGKTCIIKES